MENENFKLQTEIDELKNKLKSTTTFYESKIKLMQEVIDKKEEKHKRVNKNLIDLEIQNESQSKQNRINEEIIKELTHKSEQLNEKLAILKLEAEEEKDVGKGELYRVKDKLKETEEELLVLKSKRDKMVMENMLRSPTNKNRTLSMSKSGVFIKPKKLTYNPENTLLTEPNQPINRFTELNAQSMRVIKMNKSNNKFFKGSTSKEKDEQYRSWMSKKISFSNKKILGGRRLDEKLQEYFANNKGKSPNPKTVKKKEKIARRKKTDWFISVINSLDKKLKDIKITMKRRDNIQAK